LKDPNESTDRHLDAIWFELLPPKAKKILVGVIYKPPDSDATIFTDSLEKILDKLTTNATETVLLGDFNFSYIAANTATMKFKRLTNLFHLKQLIIEPTRITENSRSLIDHCHAIKNKSKTIQWKKLRNFDVIEDNEISHFSNMVAVK